MTREQELELIKQIIWDGDANLNIISFELDIPIVELIKLKRQIDDEKRILAMQSRNKRNEIIRKNKILDKMRRITCEL